LESGVIRLSRGEEDAVFPARALVVFGANPCPCGEYSPSDGGMNCTCGEQARRDYRRKIRGPIIDRIDITRHVEPVKRHELEGLFGNPEPSAAVAERVGLARERQGERYAGHPWRVNGHVPGPVLKRCWPLDKAPDRVLTQQLLDGKLTQRGAVRVHRLAWTVADLRGLTEPGVAEVDVALRLRRGDALPLSTVGRGPR
jgi:magnesium chelatase family protein